MKATSKIKAPAPMSQCGGSSYSRDMSRHKYSSAPPSKRGTKVKRDVMSQFCTHSACSVPKPWVVQTLKLESGHSTTKAREKCVPVKVRKEQPHFRKTQAWGIAIANKSTVSPVLDDSKAKAVLRTLACQKIERKQEEKRMRKQERMNKRVRVSAPINTLGNAFAALGM